MWVIANDLTELKKKPWTTPMVNFKVHNTNIRLRKLGGNLWCSSKLPQITIKYETGINPSDKWKLILLFTSNQISFPGIKCFSPWVTWVTHYLYSKCQTLILRVHFFQIFSSFHINNNNNVTKKQTKNKAGLSLYC